MKPSCYLNVSNSLLQSSLKSALIEKDIDVSSDQRIKHDYAIVDSLNIDVSNISSKVIVISEKETFLPGAKLVLLKKSESGLATPEAAERVVGNLFGFWDKKPVSLQITPLKQEITKTKASKSKFLLALLSFLSLPFWIYAFSLLSLFAGLYTFDKSPKVAKTAFTASVHTSSIFGNIAYADLINESALVNKKFLNVSASISDLKKDDFGNALRKLSLDLESLYKDISFLDTKIESNKIASVLGVNISNDTRELVSVAQLVTDSLPQLIGEEWDENYLVLFQDESVIRPTGGKITHAAIFSIREGEVNHFRFLESSEIDSKIEGVVQVPFEVTDGSDYQWHFEDINWDISFEKTAEYARWFIDKALDEDVEHVFLIKQDAIDTLSKIFETNNMESLSRTLANSIFDTNLFISLKQQLDQKNIYVYSTDPKVEQLVLSQNWGGEVFEKRCQNFNCLDIATNVYSFQTSGGNANLEFNFNPKLTSVDYVNNLMFELIVKNADNSPYEGYLTFSWDAIKGVSSKREFISLKPKEELARTYEINYPFTDNLENIYLKFNTPNEIRNGEINFNFVNKKGGFVQTLPFMNLTNEGEFEYTTSLEQIDWLEINFEK